jgi:hypothetical protein
MHKRYVKWFFRQLEKSSKPTVRNKKTQEKKKEDIVIIGFRSQYLDKAYDLPIVVRESPNFARLFQREAEIVTDGNKWGQKVEGVEFPVEFKYDTFFEAYDDRSGFSESHIALYFSKKIGNKVFGDPTKKNGSNFSNLMYTRKQEDGNYRIYSSHKGSYWVKNLEKDFKRWKVKNKQLKELGFKKKHFLLIYDWLNTHPIFWKEIASEDFVNWDTESGISTLYTAPVHSRIKKHSYYWIVEGGQQVTDGEHAPYASTFYHDMDLDCGGATYESALICFARSIHKKFPLKTLI